MEKTKFGAYPLTSETINSLVEHRIGNYELGSINENGDYKVEYIGRSDTDLNDRLKDHIGKYSEFKYSYATSVLDAYLTEVSDYYRFGRSVGLDNKNHPAFPKGHDIMSYIERIERTFSKPFQGQGTK